jgi:flagellar motor switch/type III secretory pathway protein FliN
MVLVAENIVAQAIALQPETISPDASAAWAPVLTLPCELTVDLPVRGFRLGALLQLEPTSVIDTHWQLSADVPLRVNGELIAWGEFEVVGDRLGIRLIELM